MNLEHELNRSWSLFQSGVPVYKDGGALAVDDISPAPGLMTQEAMALGDTPTPKALDSTGRAFGGGIRDTAQQVLNVGGELVDGAAQLITGQPIGALNAVKDLMPKVETNGLYEDLGRMATNLVSSYYIARGAGLKGATSNGAFVSALFDPEEGNMSTFLKELGIENDVINFLDSKVEDDATAADRLTSRLKNAVEGIGIGYAFDGLMSAFNWIKSNPTLSSAVASFLGASLMPDDAEGGVLNKVMRPNKGTITKLGKAEGESVAAYIERMNKEAPIVTNAADFTAIYGDIPQTAQGMESPAVALRSSEARDFIPVLPTGELDGKQTAASAFAQIGGYFDSLTRMKNGGVPRVWSNPENKKQIIDEAASEVRFQLGLGDPAKRDFTKKTGWGWYDEDIQRTFNTAGQVMPELKMDAKRGVRIPWGDASDNVTPSQARILAAAVGAPQSFGNPASRNADIKFQAYEVFRKTGQFPEKGIFLDEAGDVASTGKYWTQRAVSEQYIGVLNTLIREIGPAKAADWLVGEHSIAELRDLKRRAVNAAGEQIFKGEGTMGISGKATEMKPGAFVFGPKGGQFMGNLLGFPGTTTDMWFTRTWNRYLGTSREGVGALADTGLVEQPRNLAERREMADFSRQLTDHLNTDQDLVGRLGRPMTERDTQAVLWYFEQNLYNDMGVRVRPTSFGEGATSYAKRAKEQGGTGIPRRPSNGSNGGANAAPPPANGP